MSELNGEKPSIRGELRALRNSAEDRAERSRAIAQNLLSMPRYLEAEDLLCYVSVGSETDTLTVLRAALEMGKRVFVPKCLSAGRMEFHRIESLGALHSGKFGIPEPESGPGTLWRGGKAICLVPGLGFSENGGRIGYGGGYYDRFLKGSHLWKAGLCFEFQIIDRVPEGPCDVRMDAVITDRRVICCRDASGNEKGEDEKNER